MRIPANELDALVTERVAAAFNDPVGLAAECGIALEPRDFHRLHEQGKRAAGSGNARDRALVRLLVEQVAKAHHWWGELRTSGLDIRGFAAREGINATYMSRMLRLAFLSPAVVDAILDGTIGAGTAVARIVKPDGLPLSWTDQGSPLSGEHVR